MVLRGVQGHHGKSPDSGEAAAQGETEAGGNSRVASASVYPLQWSDTPPGSCWPKPLSLLRATCAASTGAPCEVGAGQASPLAEAELGSVRDIAERLTRSQRRTASCQPRSEPCGPRALNPTKRSRLPLPAGTTWPSLGAPGRVSGRGTGRMGTVTFCMGLALRCSLTLNVPAPGVHSWLGRFLTPQHLSAGATPDNRPAGCISCPVSRMSKLD